MKQTAVDWLKDMLEWNYGDPKMLEISWVNLDDLFERAKQMEKEQILNAWSVATNPDYEIGFGDMFYILEQEKKAEKYYNETFNTKEK
jgi:hypothetical protein